MNKTYLIFLLLSLFCKYAFCQESDQGIDSLVLELKLRDSIIYELDVIEYTVTVSNLSDSILSIPIPWSSKVKPLIEFRTCNDCKWIPLKWSDKGEGYFFNRRLPISPESEKAIQSKEHLSKTFYWAPFFPKEELSDYLSLNHIEIRARIKYNDSSFLESNSYRIRIAPYISKENLAALQWLIDLSYPSFFYEFVAYGSWGLNYLNFPDVVEKCEYLIEKHPTSTFADWGKLHLAMVYFTGINDLSHGRANPDYKLAKFYLDQISNDAHPFVQEKVILIERLITEASTPKSWKE